MIEKGADQKAEKPERIREDSGRTAKAPSSVRQELTVCSEKAEGLALMVMEEVVSR